MHTPFEVKLLPACVLTAGLVMTVLAAPQSPGAPASPKPASDFRPVVDKYCVTCHNQRLKTAGLTLDTMDMKNPAANAENWEKVIRKLSVGVMPPAGLPRPDEATRQALILSLETSLDRSAALHPYPGSPSVHRLNRVEYANAVRDLVAVRIDAEDFLPPDTPAYGFDNIGDALSIPPSLVERYAVAAGEVATLAVGLRNDVAQKALVFHAPPDLSQDKRNEGLPLGTTGGFAVKVTLPLDAEYEIKSSLFTSHLGLIRGISFPREFQILVDGERVFSKTFGGADQYNDMLQNPTAFGEPLEAGLRVKVPISAGPHVIGVTFAERSETVDSQRLQAMIRTTSDTSETLLGQPHIDTISITGPFNPTGPGNTPSRQKIFTCRPAKAADEPVCARKIIATLAHRAYRGTETSADIEELLGFYREGRKEGDFDSGIGLALQRILAGPKFLVRVEEESAKGAGVNYRVSDLDLASRLSFFLWSSIPDDELLQIAKEGKLHDPAVLEREVRRMLADSKSEALVSNFAGQWLQLRNLSSSVPDPRRFPDFDDQLRQAFRRETELFFASIVTEDRSVTDLMDANYTFVNERLAKHYGIPYVSGDQFRRVEISADARRGLLGQGSILTVTSHSDRTSPVVRGKWVLDNILGTPPPPPPPNVPPLKEEEGVAKPMTMRERMERHRADPGCASCHKVMDPIGFALENFDAVGAWRTRESRVPIDTSGVFIDGSSIDGPVALRQALLRHPENFVNTFTVRLLTYALGRGLDYRDMPTVRGIINENQAKNYRFSGIVLGIVKSLPFQMRVQPSSSDSEAAGQ
jgi:hypothetical protein